MDKLTSDMTGAIQPQESDRTILLAAKGSSIVFLGSVFGYGSQLVLGILLTRLLGAEQYGQYKVAVIAGEFAGIFALLGLDWAMVRFVSLFSSQHNKARLWGTIQVGAGLAMLTSVAIGIGLFALAAPLAENLFHDPQLAPILRLASMIVPFGTLSNVLAGATRGFNKMQYTVGAQQFALPLTRLILLVPLALLGLTAQKAVIPYIVGLVVTCVLLLYFLNHLFTLRQPLKSGQRDIREILRFSLPAYVSTLIDKFGPSLQTILLGSLNTMATVGIFAAATQVSTASTLFNQSIGTASDPIVSELHGKKNITQLAHYYKTVTKWMFTVNFPMFLIVLLLSRPILAIFGNEFVEGTSALTILALANLVIAAAGISDGVLAMTGNTSIKLVNSAVQASTTIGMCALLIPRYGAVGAAGAVLISYTVVHLLLVIEIFVLFRMIPYTVSFYKPVVAGLVALIIGWFTFNLLHTGANLLLAVINAIIIMGVYAGMIFVLGLSPEDRAVFDQFRRRIAVIFLRK